MTPKSQLEAMSKDQKIDFLKKLIDRKTKGTPGRMPDSYGSPHHLTDAQLVEVIQEWERL
jgi:hypothetical protein